MSGQSGVALRPARRSDRAAIRKILEDTGLFRSSEIAVALEVIDVYLDQPGQEDYIIQTAEAAGSAAGYVCFGLNTMTEGTVELYWIAVAPAQQGRGIGGALLAYAEEQSRRLGGRMVCSETSSREDYGATLNFYLHHGYREAARVADYYAPGDDKVIFTKQL